MKTLHIALCAAIAVATVAQADTFAEKNYAFGGLGIISYGDASLTGFILEGGVNYNVASQIDAIGTIRYNTASKGGVTASRFDIGADGMYWFSPKQKINPFAGAGLFVASAKAEAKYNIGFGEYKSSVSETKVGLKLFGGAEIDLDPAIWFRPGIEIDFISSSNDIGIGVTGGYKITEELSPYAKFEFWTKNSDVVLMVGATFKF
ncbi:MAG: porin family protein [Kiritimatiellaeota bacterium]|nr:porin family protein [Kiritimatiellota bacterium]